MRLRHGIALACALAGCGVTRNRPPAYACSYVAPVPTCIAERIERMCSEPADPTDERPSVTRYRYRGQQAYYIPPRCCDIPSQLLDAQCRIICQPDGGISGGGDGKCSDFVATRGAGELVWEHVAPAPPASSE
jgi:hypothetical protein